MAGAAAGEVGAVGAVGAAKLVGRDPGPDPLLAKGGAHLGWGGEAGDDGRETGLLTEPPARGGFDTGGDALFADACAAAKLEDGAAAEEVVVASVGELIACRPNSAAGFTGAALPPDEEEEEVVADMGIAPFTGDV